MRPASTFLVIQLSNSRVSYYDYSHDERFQTNLKYFGDADHLNPDGAVYFTGLLTEEVADLKAYLETH